MRDASLAIGRLGEPGLDIVDVGAGTGFTTEGILAAAAPDARVTMVDQSTHQLRRARAQARPRRRRQDHRRRRGAALRRRPLRPLRLDGLDRVLARPAARDRRGLPRRAPRRRGARRRPARAHPPARAGAVGRVDAVPARGRLPRLDGARGLHRRPRASTSRPSGGTPAGTPTRWRSPGRSPRPGPSPAGACAPLAPEEPPAVDGRAAWRASPAARWPAPRSSRSPCTTPLRARLRPTSSR